MDQARAIFVCFQLVVQKILEASGIQTRIVRVERDDTDH